MSYFDAKQIMAAFDGLYNNLTWTSGNRTFRPVAHHCKIYICLRYAGKLTERTALYNEFIRSKPKKTITINNYEQYESKLKIYVAGCDHVNDYGNDEKVLVDVDLYYYPVNCFPWGNTSDHLFDLFVFVNPKEKIEYFGLQSLPNISALSYYLIFMTKKLPKTPVIQNLQQYTIAEYSEYRTPQSISGSEGVDWLPIDKPPVVCYVCGTKFNEQSYYLVKKMHGKHWIKNKVAPYCYVCATLTNEPKLGYVPGKPTVQDLIDAKKYRIYGDLIVFNADLQFDRNIVAPLIANAPKPQCVLGSSIMDFAMYDLQNKDSVGLYVLV